MADRMLEATPSELSQATGRRLVEWVRNAEGRTILCEVVTFRAPAVPGITNAELAAAFGADMVLLNGYDTDAPTVSGLPAPMAERQPLEAVRRLTGRAVGINLEPVPPGPARLPLGRTLTEGSCARAIEQGAQYLVLTGNPHTGVTNEGILAAVGIVRRIDRDVMLIAGKMHGAGAQGEQGARTADPDTAKRLVEAGADVVLSPAPGTVPGFTVDRAADLVRATHDTGGLSLLAIGTCQEGADEETIRQIAMAAKMAGADVHHLGDCGFSGVAPPENILTYSVTVRGRTHTYRRMAQSLVR